MRFSSKRGAALGAIALTTLGLAATAGASIQQLPPGAQVNDDPAAGIDPSAKIVRPSGSIIATGASEKLATR